MSKNRFVKFSMFFLCLLMVGVTSCTKSKTQRMQEAEKADRAKYLKENNISPDDREVSGLYYVEDEAGEGDLPQYGDRVQVWYTGTFLDGEQFDSNEENGRFEPLTVFIGSGGGTIQGMIEGVAKMKKGGKATLIIPSSLGYGSMGTYGIAPYTTLVFKVEVHDIIRAEQ